MITGLYPVQYQLRLNEHIEQRKREEDRLRIAGRYARKRMWTSVEKAERHVRVRHLAEAAQSSKATLAGRAASGGRTPTATAGFDEGMTEGWDMSKFGTDDFFHEMMGAEGNELVRETMDAAVRLHRSSSGRADVHLVWPDAAAHAAGRTVSVPQVLRGQATVGVGEAVLQQHHLVGRRRRSTDGSHRTGKATDGATRCSSNT